LPVACCKKNKDQAIQQQNDGKTKTSYFT